MKKVITTVLAFAIVGAMSFTSSAQSPITQVNGTDSNNVKATYSTADRTDVYSVDVAWGGMEFEYVEASKTWDTVNHKWVDADGSNSVWQVKSGSDNTITLKNNSSKAVNATFKFDASSSFTGMDGKFTYGGNALTSAVSLEKPVADTPANDYVVTFMPTSELSNTTTTESTIGTITVTIK